MRKTYLEPKTELISFGKEDIVTTSGGMVEPGVDNVDDGDDWL